MAEEEQVQELGTAQSSEQEEKPAEAEEPADWGEDISPQKDGGLFKKIITEGIGKETAMEGEEVFVHYVGTLLDGSVFDSSHDRNEYFKFTLGLGQVIKGWDVGVATMHKGEKCLLTCRPEYAYGQSGSPPKIPPNATLQFEVELFKWQGEDLTKDGGVQKSIITKGDEYSKPSEGSICNVHIRGMCAGRVFDERDVSFEYGEGSEAGLVPGVEKAIGAMKSKESARVVVQPQYGYGEEGNTDLEVPGNAELVYHIRLNGFQKTKQSWEYDSVDERKAEAMKLKERGTTHFKASKFQLAVKQYKRGAELATSHKEEEKEQMKEVRVALHLNLAACYLKLSEPNLAIKECEEVLGEDDKSTKAYFRKGQARQILQDYDDAIVDYQEVLKLEPGNKAAQAQILQSRNKLKAVREREKKRYAKMFAKLAEEREKEEEKAAQEAKLEGKEVKEVKASGSEEEKGKASTSESEEEKGKASSSEEEKGKASTSGSEEDIES